eukprot:SAG22_NODE_68_length_22846_cov_32.458258_4_plen_156_part_00
MCVFVLRWVPAVAGLKADTQLLGGSYFESAQVQQWQDFAATLIDLPISNWVYQILGWMAYSPQITKKAQQDVKASLAILDSHLLNNAFLVGTKITLADVSLVCSLHLGYVMVRCRLRAPSPACAAAFLAAPALPRVLLWAARAVRVGGEGAASKG